jgi:hypothetical protein
MSWLARFVYIFQKGNVPHGNWWYIFNETYKSKTTDILLRIWCIIKGTDIKGNWYIDEVTGILLREKLLYWQGNWYIGDNTKIL